MSNENINYKFLDQQFIQTMYEGNVNSLNKERPDTINFTVKFMIDDTIYQIIYVGENQKISAPVNAPIKEGYEFKNWLLNDEVFNFNTIITNDTVLTAKFEEVIEVLETTIIPVSLYETEDTGYGDGYLEFTAIEPAIIDDAVLGEYINEVDAAVEGGTLESIKHTINVNDTTLADQTLNSDPRLGITYFGNVSLYDESGEDTGENWFLGVSSTLAFTTKTPTTINFGLSYKIV